MEWATKRDFLFRLNPKKSHEYVLKYLSLMPKSKRPEWAKRNNKLGLAAGFDVNAKALWAWQSIGFGFVEIGTITLNPQQELEKGRIIRLQQSNALIQNIGLPNDGIQKVIKRIAHAKKKGLELPIYLNIAKGYNTSVQDTPGEFEQMAFIAKGKVDGLVVNLQNNFASLHEIIPRIIYADPETPIYIKVGLDANGLELKTIIKRISQYGVKGVIIGNSLPVELGMLSGKPIKDYATSKTEMVKSLCDENYIPVVISCGGVDSIKSAQEKINAGADFIQLYTGLVYNGFDIVKKIVEALNEY